jgi:hypothetical protein
MPSDIALVSVHLVVNIAWIFCLAIPFVVVYWAILALSSIVSRIFQ